MTRSITCTDGVSYVEVRHEKVVQQPKRRQQSTAKVDAGRIVCNIGVAVSIGLMVCMGAVV